MAELSLAEAVKACEQAVAKSRELGIKIAVSVVDSGTNLVSMQKMDGALVLAVEGSRGKAIASTIFGQPSGELEQRGERPVFRALQIQMGGRLIMSQGAVPITRDGQVIGACGVGGGTSEEDEECARAGVDSL